jgi:two-component system response regulator
MTTPARPPIVIVMADDNEGDCRLARESFQEYSLRNEFLRVQDGQALLDYLRNEGEFRDMPRKDGHQVLREIKADPSLSRIPVIVLTISQEQSDELRAYDLGAAAYMTKPVEFRKLVDLIHDFSFYWFEVVHIPPA